MESQECDEHTKRRKKNPQVTFTLWMKAANKALKTSKVSGIVGLRDTSCVATVCTFITLETFC